jgi:hypothetical protein
MKVEEGTRRSQMAYMMLDTSWDMDSIVFMMIHRSRQHWVRARIQTCFILRCNSRELVVEKQESTPMYRIYIKLEEATFAAYPSINPATDGADLQFSSLARSCFTVE